MTTLIQFFQEPKYEMALNRYGEMSEKWDWPISTKLEMYNLSKIAFNSNKPERTKRMQYNEIYESLRINWHVFLGTENRVWTADQVFYAFSNACSSWSQQTGFNILDIRINSRKAESVLVCLENLRDLKSQKNYPWVAVAKFCHFYNPMLFPIYDIALIWNVVLQKAFKVDYREWCSENGCYWNEQSARFNLNYICFAADVMRQADDNFMDYFGEWFRSKAAACEDENGVLNEIDGYYATAFEFIPIGASYL